MLHGSHKSDVFWIGRMDGADACNMPYMPCVCAHNGFGFGFNAGRACLLCVPGLSDLCYFLKRPTLVRKGRSGLLFDTFGGVGT